MTIEVIQRKSLLGHIFYKLQLLNKEMNNNTLRSSSLVFGDLEVLYNYKVNPQVALSPP